MHAHAQMAAAGGFFPLGSLVVPVQSPQRNDALSEEREVGTLFEIQNFSTNLALPSGFALC